MRAPSLKTKLQLSFLLVGLLSIVVTGWQSFENARGVLEQITFDRLTAIRETKKRQIESYFTQIGNQITSLAKDRMIVEAIGEFARAVRSTGRGQGADFGLDLQEASQGHHILMNSRHPQGYMKVHGLYDPFLRDYATRFRYEDILLVDARSGFVMYSVSKKGDFATNLMTGPLRGTNISQVFGRVVAAKRGFVGIADFAPYAVSDSSPAAFIAAPVFDKSTRLGVIILRISLGDINNLMTSDKNWKAEGLGETGETYIVGSDFRMRSDSRFFIQEPERYFKQLIKIGHDSATVRRIRARATSTLLQEARTEATVDALNGHTDTRIINDYRNVPVLSSYTPLSISGVRWVMLAEIDASEAFHSVYDLREKLILAALVILLLASALGVVISRTILRPIFSLSRTAEEFGKGDFSSRSEVQSRDEIGLLSSAFNRMAENIAEKTGQLQKEIQERIRAEEGLRHSQERLRNLSTHLQSVREDERKGLAREIHDELGQALSTIKLNLSLLKSEIQSQPSVVEGRLSSVFGIVDATIRSVKRLITQLRPRLLDDLGLTAAMEWQAEEFQRRTGISCHVQFSPEEILLDPDRSTAIFRIFQESLTNVARHAGATDVLAELRVDDDSVYLMVEDNGRGITAEQVNDARSFGLLGIRERARYWGGSADISGFPGKGTRVMVDMHLA